MKPLFKDVQPRTTARAWQPPAAPPVRQRVLFSGLGCCPGQYDLFPTDIFASPFGGDYKEPDDDRHDSLRA